MLELAALSALVYFIILQMFIYQLKTGNSTVKMPTLDADDFDNSVRIKVGFNG